MGQLEKTKILRSLARYLDVQNPVEIDNLIKQKEKLLNDENVGLSWVIFNLAKKKPYLLAQQCKEDNLLIRQWLEYASNYLNKINLLNSQEVHSILKELNDEFADKVFLLKNQKSIIDVIYYFALHSVVTKLSLHDKETYIHLSRWFNHMQQDEKLRQNHPTLVFNRTLLYN